MPKERTSTEKKPTAPPPPPAYNFDTLPSENYLNLGRLPIPKLEDTVAKLVASCKAVASSDEEVAAIEAAAKEFAEGVGKELQTAVEEGDKHEGFPFSYIGNGSSMACISGGKCLDTTMGMTPLEGLVMGTRSGDVDCGIYTHLTKAKEMTPKDVDTMLNKKSGLAGLCGTPDMREVIEGAEGGSEDHKNALGVFVHRVRKYLGSFLVKLGGKCDAIVFTGGIGENAKLVREMVCKDLAPIGIELDEGKNNTLRGLNQLETSASRTKIMIVPTNEELSIALQSTAVAGVAPKPKPVSKVEASGGMEVASLPGADNIFDVNAKVTNGLYLEVLRSESEIIFDVGILSQAMTTVSKIGYFRPFAKGGASDDAIVLAKELYGIADSAESMYGVTIDDAMALLAHGKEDELIDQIVAKYEAYSPGKEFVLVSGAELPAESHDWNTKICGVLNLPMAMLLDWNKSDENPLESVYQQLMMSRAELSVDGNNVDLAGVMVNRIPADGYEETRKALIERFADDDIKVLATIPHDKRIASKSLSQIAAECSATPLYGAELVEGRLVNDIMVGLDSMPDLINTWKSSEMPMIIINASQGAVLLSTLLAANSPAIPPLAGIMLIGSNPLGEEVQEVVSHIKLPVPILQSPMRIDKVIKVMQNMDIAITAKSPKIEVISSLMDSSVDKESMTEIMGSSQIMHMTPKLFQYKIFTAARSQKMRIVLPEGEDKRVVMAAADLAKRDLCHLTVLGKPEEVLQLAATHQADLTGVEIINPPDAPDYEELVAKLVELRGAKGMTEEKARDLIAGDFNWYGTMRMAVGTLDGMVSGACHTTADTMRPALQVIKTAPGFSLVSSIFFMLLPHQVFVYGDCAINVEPNPAQLAEIAATSALTAKSFGIAPRVAMLSYATGDSNKGAIIDKVKEATATARELDQTGAAYEGPIQFDAAVDPEIAKVKFKGKENAVAGKATVCVFPDLNAGNNAYKAVQQASGCIAMGPIMQGMKKPVNDLSRGCTVDDIVNTVVITCIQAQAVAKK